MLASGGLFLFDYQVKDGSLMYSMLGTIHISPIDSGSFWQAKVTNFGNHPLTFTDAELII